MLEYWRTPPSARSLALGFLSTARGPIKVADLIRRAEVMAIDGAAMRVALGRLTREGIVAQPERGLYAIGPGGAALDRRARGWAETRVRDWHGRWLVVLADHLGRSDRRRVRERERALTLYGFARSDAGVWVRPDNLAEPLIALMQQMQAIGLDADASAVGEAAALDDAAWRGLWPVAAIGAACHYWIAQMQESLARLPDLSDEEAARETLLLGQSVIRAINRDPFLPAELVNAALREEMIAGMRRYDTVGKDCWSRIT